MWKPEAEQEERTSLLGATTKDYRSTKDPHDPVVIRRNSILESITYTWNNLSVWTDSSGSNPGSATYTGHDLDLEASGSRSQGWSYPWKKKGQKYSKQILNQVNGIVRPGELLAVMGASGAGKTTLLNVLTFRNPKALRVNGTRSINGVPIDVDTLRALSAYVQQDDLFVATLTVREHLIFQALLRMDPWIPRAQRLARVDELISDFGLIKCSHTLIGEAGRIKGISGGEMKRLAFASEVLTNPLLMFCDEPTSGLDSFMAVHTVSILKEMARKGKTILCTIHQPSSELFTMFDRILLLAEGRNAFLGTTDEAVKFFSTQGYSCPMTFNPGDYFIETLAIQPGAETECLGTINRICTAFAESSTGKELEALSTQESADSAVERDLYSLTSGIRSRSPYKANWWAQFGATLWRAWLTIIREPMVLRLRFLQTAMTAFLLSIIYWGQVLNQDGVMNINGAIFLFLTNMTFQNVFAVINVFCNESKIFLREHLNGMYRTDVYFLTKTLAELPLFIIFPILFTLIVYFAIGLYPDAIKFGITVGIAILVSNVACSFGYFVSCLSPNVTVALSIAAPSIIPLMIFGGFLLNQASVPVYFIWLKYLSWFKYGNEALLINQWESVDSIECNRSNATCPANGNVILNTFNFSAMNFDMDVTMLVILLIGYRFMAYLALLAKTYRN